VASLVPRLDPAFALRERTVQILERIQCVANQKQGVPMLSTVCKNYSLQIADEESLAKWPARRNRLT
jgi:hypothetical protein